MADLTAVARNVKTPKEPWQERLENYYLSPLLAVMTQGLLDFTKKGPRLPNAAYHNPTNETERIRQLMDIAATGPTMQGTVPASYKVGRKQIALTEDIIRRLEGSVVRDAKGAPLQVYHGTPYSFDKFSLDASTNSDPSYGGKGIWWTNAPSYATTYALNEVHDVPIKGKIQSAIYRAYLDIKKPFDFSQPADWAITDDIISRGTPTYVNKDGNAKPVFITESGRRYLPSTNVHTLDDLMKDLLFNYRYIREKYPNSTNSGLHDALGLGDGTDWFNAIRRRGYDGIVGVAPAGMQEYAVYDPAQIVAPQKVPINYAKELLRDSLY